MIGTPQWILKQQIELIELARPKQFMSIALSLNKLLKREYYKEQDRRKASSLQSMEPI